MHKPRGGLKAAMVGALRQGKHRRGVGRGTQRKPGGGSAIVPDALKTVYRPAEIEARLVPGHWEGDMIKRASNRSSVGTPVERKSRFVTLARMERNGAAAALEGFTRQMKHLPAFLRRSLTYDRGVEMACHPELARRLKRFACFMNHANRFSFCFCAHYCPKTAAHFSECALKIDVCISRPSCTMATRIERKHQWPLAPVPPEGREPVRLLPARPGHHRQAHERPAPQDSRLENPQQSPRRGNRTSRCSWNVS
jgi:hypothetical protein